MNTVAKVILISAAVSLPALSGSAYSHQESGSKGNSMMEGMMMGDDQGSMSSAEMPEHMQMMKIMNTRMNMMQMMEHQEQDQNLE